jgi:hypothetical protein
MNQRLETAVSIAARIRVVADDDRGRLSWTTLVSDGTGTTWRRSESLYGGVAGIALLFLELYAVTGDEADLRTAIGALQWLIFECEQRAATHYGFYTGRLGVAEVLGRAYDITGDEAWLDAALSIAHAGAESPEATSIADVLSGHSGAVLALLRLHARRPETWIVRWIDRLLARLANECVLAPAGVHWDRSGHQMQGLCGLSHGASGCGLAFLEAGRYFGDDALVAVARQAFAYEASCFDARTGNWPDFRRSAHTEEERQREEAALATGRLDYFRRPGDMNAWCHGALGIGLVRLRAAELLPGQGYEGEVEAALARTRNTKWGNALTLCHGGAGAAMFFARAGLHAEAGAIVATIAAAEREGCPFRSGFAHCDEEDRSLMMGIAGIAYALLDPAASILLPTCGGAPHPVRGGFAVIGRGAGTLARRMLGSRYGRTLDALAASRGATLDDELARHGGVVSMRAALERSVTAAANGAAAAYAYEREKEQLDESIESRALLRVVRAGRLAAASRVVSAPDGELAQIRFAPAPECRRSGGALFVATPDGVLEFLLAPLTGWLLDRFIGGARPDVIAAEAVADHDGDARARAAVLAQVRELVAAGVLVACPEPG